MTSTAINGVASVNGGNYTITNGVVTDSKGTTIGTTNGSIFTNNEGATVALNDVSGLSMNLGSASTSSNSVSDDHSSSDTTSSTNATINKNFTGNATFNGGDFKIDNGIVTDSKGNKIGVTDGTTYTDINGATVKLSTLEGLILNLNNNLVKDTVTNTVTNNTYTTVEEEPESTTETSKLDQIVSLLQSLASQSSENKKTSTPSTSRQSLNKNSYMQLILALIFGNSSGMNIFGMNQVSQRSYQTNPFCLLS